MLDSFTAAQEMAQATRPGLTGDQLDRIGNLIVDQAPAASDITGPMLGRAITRVTTTMMEN